MFTGKEEYCELPVQVTSPRAKIWTVDLLNAKQFYPLDRDLCGQLRNELPALRVGESCAEGKQEPLRIHVMTTHFFASIPLVSIFIAFTLRPNR
jgi:hypothetical protein